MWVRKEISADLTWK